MLQDVVYGLLPIVVQKIYSTRDVQTVSIFLLI